MEKKFTHIDELFKNKLQSHQAEPPAHLWSNISQELDNGRSIDDVFDKSLNHKEVAPPAYVWDNISTSLDKLSTKRKTRIWWMFGSGAAVIAAFVAGYFIADFVQKESATQQLSVTLHEQDNAEKLLNSTKENGALHVQKNIKTPNRYSSEKVDDSIINYAEDSNYLAKNGNKKSTPSAAGIKNTSKTQKPVSGNNLKDEPEDQANKLSENQAASKNDEFISGETANNIKLAEELSLENSQNVRNAVEQSDTVPETSQIAQNNNTATGLEKGNASNKTEQFIDLYEGLDPAGSYYPVISISPFFSPMYAWRNSFNDESKYDPIDPGTANNRFDHTTRFSYQAGVLLGYYFTRNISVHLGCSYNQITHSTARGQLQTIPFSQAGIYDSALTVQTSAGALTGISVDPNLNNPDVDPTINIEQTLLKNPIQQVIQTIGFVEVPVLIKYRIATSRVGFLFTGGFSSGFIVRNDAFAENQYEYVRFGETANIRNVNFNLVLGAGLDVQITPWLFFTFEPTLRYSLMNWSVSNDVKINPFLLGANTGLSFRF